MTVETISIDLKMKGNADIRDITPAVIEGVQKSSLTSGAITLFCPSSTSGLTTIEYESGCLKDLRRLFDELVDPGRHYEHNARWGDGNGHSHIRASLLGASLTVPFVDKRLTLGTWQQIIYVDFDNKNRSRSIIGQLIGE